MKFRKSLILKFFFFTNEIAIGQSIKQSISLSVFSYQLSNVSAFKNEVNKKCLNEFCFLSQDKGNMLKYLYLSFLMSFQTVLFAQNTFSKLFPLPPLRATVLNSIVVTDTAYYATGIVSDSVFPFQSGALFLRTDLEGNIEVAKAHIDSINRYETWFQSLVFDNNDLLTHGYNFNNDSTIFFINYNLNGNIKTISNVQLIKDNFESSFSFIKNKSEIIFSSVSLPLQGGFQKKFISCLDQNRKIKWSKEISVNNPNFTFPQLVQNENGYLVGGWGSPDYPHKNTINQCELFQFDTLGNQFWEYKSPINEDWAGTLGGLAMSDDGDIVYASGKGTIMNPQEISDYFTWDWCFTKLGFDKKIKWRTYFKQPRRDIDENGRRLWNMLKLKDKGGYISVGTTVLDKSYGWIVKVSEDGDSLWSRTYNLEDDSTAFYEIRQAKEDNEGNLVMVGERINYEPDLYSQQGWMMKLDKYGCLVPDCHLVATEEIASSEIEIKIYPNPANDFLAFIFNQNNSNKIRYNLVSLNGTIIKQGEANSIDTNIINVSRIQSGQYILNVTSENNNSYSKTIIIQH